jgi:cytochrome c oxidase subunit 2
MTGWVDVMKPVDFQNWITGGSETVPMEVAGKSLFQRLGCDTCHSDTATSRGPSLTGLFGTQVELTTGQTVTADEDYIREAIVAPAARTVAGYQPIIPTFKGQVSDQQILQLIAYIKSLGQAQKEANRK